MQSIGRFTVDTYKVAWISNNNTALTALENHQVDVLDINYNFKRTALQQIPGINVLTSAGLGWQEQAFNMMHPVFGTGVGTPLGMSDPSRAAEAARHVRTAISHLIPRQNVVNVQLGGSGYPLAEMLGPGWGSWYDPTIQPDAYDFCAAADELRAAGYSPAITCSAVTISSNPSGYGLVIALPSNTADGSTITPPQTVNWVTGSTHSVSGSPSTNAPFAGWTCSGSLSCSGPSPTTTLAVTGPGTVTANFGSPMYFDFRLYNTGSSSNLGGTTVARGSSGSITITGAFLNGPAQTVTLSCSQANGSPLPSGVSCSSASGTPPFTVTLTVTVSSSTPPGYYTIKVTGTSGSLTRITLFTLDVT